MRLKSRRVREVESLERASRANAAGSDDGPLTLIDQALTRFVSRRIVSAAEIVDVLLDVRSALVFDATFAEFVDELKVR